jgi:hypothetical protein
MEIGSVLNVDIGDGNIVQQKVVEIDKDENGRIIGYTTVDVIPQ